MLEVFNWIILLITTILGFFLINYGLKKDQFWICLLGILLTGILFGTVWWLIKKENTKHYKTCFVCKLKFKPSHFNLCCLKCQSCCYCLQKIPSLEQEEQLKKLLKEREEKLATKEMGEKTEELSSKKSKGWKGGTIILVVVLFIVMVPLIVILYG